MVRRSRRCCTNRRLEPNASTLPLHPNPVLIEREWSHIPGNVVAPTDRLNPMDRPGRKPHDVARTLEEPVNGNSHLEQFLLLINQLHIFSNYKMWRRISNHTHDPGQTDGSNQLKFCLLAKLADILRQFSNFFLEAEIWIKN